MLATRDITWLVGFLEGEGSFYFNRTASISASQVQRWPLDRCRALVGGSVCLITAKTRASSIYGWKLTGPMAAGLAMTLYPLLSPRRQEQIRNAIAAWRARRAAPKFAMRCRAGHPLIILKNGSQRGCPPCRAAAATIAQRRRRARRAARRAA